MLIHLYLVNNINYFIRNRDINLALPKKLCYGSDKKYRRGEAYILVMFVLFTIHLIVCLFFFV